MSQKTNVYSSAEADQLQIKPHIYLYIGLYLFFMTTCLIAPVLVLGYPFKLALLQLLLSLPFFIFLIYRMLRFVRLSREYLNQTLNEQLEIKLRYSTVMDEIKYHERLREATFNTSSMILDAKSDQIFDRTINQALSIIQGAKSGSIALIAPDGLLEFVATKNHDLNMLTNAKIHITETFLYRLSNGHISAPIIVTDVSQLNPENRPNSLYRPLDLDQSDASKIASALSAPLYKDGNLIGVITLDSDVPNAFTEEDKRVLGYFASIVGIALKYRELLDETVYLSQHDKLTGIYNRRHFEEIFTKYQESSYRQNKKFTLVIMDLNYLKSINDTFGHIYGDAALCKFTDLVKPFVAPSDHFARIGGDEFILLFDELTYEQSEERMSQIFNTFKQAHVDYMTRTIPIQFSYGIASCPEESMILDILVKIADNRMYQHKKALKEMNQKDNRFSIFNTHQNFSSEGTL